jgi:hypothetical protein
MPNEQKCATTPEIGVLATPSCLGAAPFYGIDTRPLSGIQLEGAKGGFRNTGEKPGNRRNLPHDSGLNRGLMPII